MPFKSKAQMRLFFAKEARGELKKGTAKRWAHHTPSISKLPEKKKKEKKIREAVMRPKPIKTSGLSIIEQWAAEHGVDPILERKQTIITSGISILAEAFPPIDDKKKKPLEGEDEAAPVEGPPEGETPSPEGAAPPAPSGVGAQTIQIAVDQTGTIIDGPPALVGVNVETGQAAAAPLAPAVGGIPPPAIAPGVVANTAGAVQPELPPPPELGALAAPPVPSPDTIPPPPPGAVGTAPQQPEPQLPPGAGGPVSPEPQLPPGAGAPVPPGTEVPSPSPPPGAGASPLTGEPQKSQAVEEPELVVPRVPGEVATSPNRLFPGMVDQTTPGFTPNSAMALGVNQPLNQPSQVSPSQEEITAALAKHAVGLPQNVVQVLNSAVQNPRVPLRDTLQNVQLQPDELHALKVAWHAIRQELNKPKNPIPLTPPVLPPQVPQPQLSPGVGLPQA